MVEELIKIAHKEAIKNLGNDRRCFFVGSAGVRKDGVIVRARNESAEKRMPSCHAEARLTRKLGYDAPYIVVVRYSVGRKSWAMARPCPYCEAILRSHRVKKVYYTDVNGNIKSEWLN